MIRQGPSKQAFSTNVRQYLLASEACQVCWMGRVERVVQLLLKSPAFQSSVSILLVLLFWYTTLTQRHRVLILLMPFPQFRSLVVSDTRRTAASYQLFEADPPGPLAEARSSWSCIALCSSAHEGYFMLYAPTDIEDEVV